MWQNCRKNPYFQREDSFFGIKCCGFKNFQGALQDCLWSNCGPLSSGWEPLHLGDPNEKVQHFYQSLKDQIEKCLEKVASHKKLSLPMWLGQLVFHPKYFFVTKAKWRKLFYGIGKNLCHLSFANQEIHFDIQRESNSAMSF